MPPIPCAHCGNNYMKSAIDKSTHNLCNSCIIREEKRNPKGNQMETVGILIQCPRQTQAEIEEYCINNGIDFTKFFLDLYEPTKNKELVDFQEVDDTELPSFSEPEKTQTKKKGNKK